MGSGDLYSPGPATALEHRLATMWRPLNDALTSSWASAGPSPLFKRTWRPTLQHLVRSTPPSTLSRRWPCLA